MSRQEVDRAHPCVAVLRDGERLRLSGVLGSYKLRHNDGVQALAVARGGDVVLAGGADGILKVWSLQTGDEVRSMQAHRYGINALAVSADGALAASGGSDGVCVWSLEDGTEVVRFRTKAVGALAFDAFGEVLAVGSERKPQLHSVRDGSLWGALTGHLSAVKAIAFSADGDHAATSGGDGKIKLHAVRKRKVLATMAGHSSSLEFSPDGAWLLSSGFDHFKRFEVPSGKELSSLRLGGFVGAAALHPNGARVAVRVDDEARILEGSGDEVLARLPAAGSGGLAFSHGGESIVTASRGTSLGHGTCVEVWDIATTARRLPSGDGHTAAVTGLVAPANGKTLVSASIDGLVKIWDCASGREIESLGGASDVLTSLAVSDDGRVGLTSSSFSRRETRSLHVWSLADAKLATIVERQDRGAARAVAMAPDGSLGAAVFNGGKVEIFRVPDGTGVSELAGHRFQVDCVCFAAGGTRLLTGAADHQLKLWDVARGTELHSFTMDGFVNCVASAARLPVALAGASRVMLVVDVESRSARPLECSPSMGHGVEAVAVSSSGSLGAALIGREPRTTHVQLWDLTAGTLLDTIDLSPISDRGRSVTFSSDDRTLYVGTNRGAILRWALSPQ